VERVTAAVDRDLRLLKLSNGNGNGHKGRRTEGQSELVSVTDNKD
jgi:hypothetical protein